MSISAGQKGKIFSDINITPLTDIFLVLLVIMMILAPMFNEANNEIQKPDIRTGDTLAKDIINIEVTKEGGYFIDGKQVTLDSLAIQLQEYVKTNSAKKAIVTADKNTQSKYILAVIRAAQESGLEKLVVAGSPLNNTRAQELEQQTVSEDEF